MCINTEGGMTDYQKQLIENIIQGNKVEIDENHNPLLFVNR